jgi:uncharacterized protein (DUF302 family)
MKSSRLVSLLCTAAATLVFSSGLAFASPGEATLPFITERSSPHATVDETVAHIKRNIEARKGWVISGIKALDKSIKKHGDIDTLPVTLIDACNPHHAAEILKADGDRWASVMMPCTVSVYKKSDGKVYIGSMNARMIGMMFGGNVGKVMGGVVAEDQDKFLDMTN